MVSALTNCTSSHRPVPPSRPAKTRVCCAESSPCGGGREQRAERHHSGRGEEHADHRGEHDERHHARLGQREEGAQALGEARGKNLCSHREGRKPRKAKKFSTTSAASSAAAPALWAAASASGRLNATLAMPSENCSSRSAPMNIPNAR